MARQGVHGAVLGVFLTACSGAPVRQPAHGGTGETAEIEVARTLPSIAAYFVAHPGKFRQEPVKFPGALRMNLAERTDKRALSVFVTCGSDNQVNLCAEYYDGLSVSEGNMVTTHYELAFAECAVDEGVPMDSAYKPLNSYSDPEQEKIRAAYNKAFKICWEPGRFENR